MNGFVGISPLNVRTCCTHLGLTRQKLLVRLVISMVTCLLVFRLAATASADSLILLFFKKFSLRIKWIGGASLAAALPNWKVRLQNLPGEACWECETPSEVPTHPPPITPPLVSNTVRFQKHKGKKGRAQLMVDFLALDVSF